MVEGAALAGAALAEAPAGVPAVEGAVHAPADWPGRRSAEGEEEGAARPRTGGGGGMAAVAPGSFLGLMLAARWVMCRVVLAERWVMRRVVPAAR